jgi:hypothetical protein
MKDASNIRVPTSRTHISQSGAAEDQSRAVGQTDRHPPFYPVKEKRTSEEAARGGRRSRLVILGRLGTWATPDRETGPMAGTSLVGSRGKPSFFAVSQAGSQRGGVEVWRRGGCEDCGDVATAC